LKNAPEMMSTTKTGANSSTNLHNDNDRQSVISWTRCNWCRWHSQTSHSSTQPKFVSTTSPETQTH
jgi:hypothetical protein